MNLTEVKKSLDKMFARELRQGSVRNIVFWYDGDGAFADEIDSLELNGVKIIKLDNRNAFATKLYIERTDTQSNLLVYSPMPFPQSRDNWLADTVHYSQTFSTDEASLILLNYKMDASLRPIAEEYKAFFRNKEREHRFNSYKIESFDETRFDVAVLSALCKLSVPNLDLSICEILKSVLRGDTSLLDSINKFGSEARLWDLIRRTYGYPFEEQSFEKLAVVLLVTHFGHSFSKTLPGTWKDYDTHNTNAYVIVDALMHREADSYKALSDFVSARLSLPAALSKWTVPDVLECDTFPQFDEFILARVRGNIMADAGEYAEYKKEINARRNRCWFGEYESEYLTLLYACEFLQLFQKHSDFSAINAKAMWAKYRDELFKFDLYYRKFLSTYDKLDISEDYREIAEKVENAYTNGYLTELSVKWCALLDDGADENGIIPWAIADVQEQARFYDRNVLPFVRKDERIVVIISDALRYESAVELSEILNREQKGESSLTATLGVIPSYTDLGMAALLPHREITIADNGTFFADGISTKGTENRGKVLATVKAESIAVTYEAILRMNPQQMNEAFVGKKLIYIYHNAIDAEGDKASTEHKVFSATEDAFKELSGLVRKLISGISAINFIITADHGYIYRRTPLAESDKTPKITESDFPLKRRFVLTSGQPKVENTQAFSIKYLGLPELTAIVPYGANCFKMQGAGSNYVHGGSSLQEVMVPLIQFKSGRNLTKQTSARKVQVALTSLTRKITSQIAYLDFQQSEPVGEKALPLHVRVALIDENGERISNENIIIADSESANPADRVFREKFTLRNMKYDKNTKYYLVMIDDDEIVENELERIPFTVDLVFGGGIF